MITPVSYSSIAKVAVAGLATLSLVGVIVSLAPTLLSRWAVASTHR